MPSIVFYSTPAERNQLKQDAHSIGESPLHDDFIDINGNPTNGNSGRLQFDVKVTPPPTPDQITVRLIVAEILVDNSLSNIEERDFRRLYIVGGIR